MDLVYTLDFDSINKKKDWLFEEKQYFDISSQNTVCVCRQTKSKRDESKNNGNFSEFSFLYEVIVFDQDKPWEHFLVMTSHVAINNISWDKTGTRMLITDLTGQCQVWQMVDNLLNKWTCLGSSTTDGEEILAVSWFHTGVQINFNPEKRDSVLYTDKFLRSRFTPTVSHFGGNPLDGWIAITATGLISVGVISQQDQVIQTVQGSLGSNHLRLTLVSIAHTGTGEIMVATGDGQLSTSIQCFLVNIKMNQNTVSITSKASSSLYMKSQMDYGANDSQKMVVSHVQFLNSESSDTLILCCGSQTYSCLEIWTLIEQNIPLNKFFQMSNVGDTGYKIPKWMHKVTIPYASFLTSIAGPSLPMSKTFMESGFPAYIAVSYHDGSIKLIHRYTHQVIHTCFDALNSQLQTGSPLKKQKSVTYITGLKQSISGCAIIALHDGKLSVLRVYNVRDGSMALSPSYICLLLEYAMITGQDWWDIILAVKQNTIDGISQKLSENYAKQHFSMQDVVSIRLTAVKVGLYSSSTSGHQRAMDYHARLVLQAITSMFKSLLRPKSANTQDKTPSEKLSAVCMKSTDGNLENVLLNFEAEDFLVDSRRRDKSSSESALPCLQPLIQWVADFCLHLLATLPLSQSYSSFPGSSLLSDKSLLNTLRELIVIIRIWGIISPACLPIFTTAISMDGLAHLFKVITKVWQSYKESSNTDCDETLMDECCLLPSKIVIPSMNQSFRLDDSGYAVLTNSSPQLFTSGEEPSFLHTKKKVKFPFLSDVLTESQQNHDIIRQIHLGSKPSEAVRKCCRCGGYSLLQGLAKSPILKAWESRWKKSCLCGGRWKLVEI